VVKTGELTGPRGYIPGVTRVLYPDYKPWVPQTTTFSSVDGADRIEIVFTPNAVCTIVVAGLDLAETTFNEMYCSAVLDATIDGEAYHGTIPCWFESVRPRRR